MINWVDDYWVVTCSVELRLSWEYRVRLFVLWLLSLNKSYPLTVMERVIFYPSQRVAVPSEVISCLVETYPEMRSVGCCALTGRLFKGWRVTPSPFYNYDILFYFIWKGKLISSLLILIPLLRSRKFIYFYFLSSGIKL